VLSTSLRSHAACAATRVQHDWEQPKRFCLRQSFGVSGSTSHLYGGCLDQVGQIRKHSLHSIRDVLKNTLQRGFFHLPSLGDGAPSPSFPSREFGPGRLSFLASGPMEAEAMPSAFSGRHYAALPEDDQSRWPISRCHEPLYSSSPPTRARNHSSSSQEAGAPCRTSTGSFVTRPISTSSNYCDRLKRFQGKFRGHVDRLQTCHASVWWRWNEAISDNIVREGDLVVTSPSVAACPGSESHSDIGLIACSHIFKKRRSNMLEVLATIKKASRIFSRCDRLPDRTGDTYLNDIRNGTR